jgi:hypothetical protein
MGAFSINEQYRGGDYMMQAAGNISKSIRRWLDEREQREWNTGVLESSGMKEYVPAEALEKWHKMSTKQQAGYLAGAGRRMDMDLQRQQRDYANDPARLTAHPLLTSTGETIPGTFIVPKTGRVVETGRDKNTARGSDAYADLEKKVKAATGASLGEWRNSTNHRLEGGNFVADFPGEQILDAEGNPIASKGQTRRIPEALYQQLHSEVAALDNAGQMQPAANAQAAAAERPAMGGYQIGKRYQGKLYIGGDPYDPASWQ